MRAAVPLLWVAACGLAVAVDGACNASSCIFRYVCDESPNLGCCLNGTRSAGCDNNPGFCTDAHCGQVDAAPSIPKSLFKPENADKLALYISFTSGIQIKDPFCEFKQRAARFRIFRSEPQARHMCGCGLQIQARQRARADDHLGRILTRRNRLTAVPNRRGLAAGGLHRWLRLLRERERAVQPAV